MYVAMIDKDRMVIQLVQRYLDDAGYIVVEVDPDTQKDWADSADVFIIDFNHKLKSGLSAYETLRNLPEHADTPCLLISGRVTVQHVQNTKKDPAASLLLKPFTKDVFDDSLRRCLKNVMVLRSKSHTKAPNAVLKSVETNTIIQTWRQDVAALEEHLNVIKGRLQTNPRLAFEEKLKQHQSDPEAPPLNMKELKRSIMNEAILKSAVVLVYDEATKKLLMDHLRQREIFELESFENGEEVWAKIQTVGTDLLVMEWHNENLGGLALYNRIRGLASTRGIPILVISGSKNTPLIHSLSEEDGILRQIEKPIQVMNVEKTLNELVAIAHCSEKVVKAVHNSLQQSSSPEILELVVQDMTERLPSLQMHILGAVNRIVDEKRLEMGEMLARLLLEKPDFMLSAALLLAKIYHLTQRTEAATEVLAYATALAPHRIDHLLLAAEAEIVLMHPDRADAYVARASSIDATHPRVQAAAFITKNLESVSKEFGISPASRSIASILNTVGVTLAKSGKALDAERYYLSALAFLQDRMDQARLHYNLGLRYLRLREQDKAREEFVKAEKLTDGKFLKAREQLQEQPKKKRGY